MKACNFDDKASLPSLAGHRPEFLWNPTRIELITTKFMRNRLLFRTLADDLLPRLRAQKNRPLRILFWACSTGCEPYTLKFLLGPGSQDEITGIDMDAEAILQAQAGVYHPDTWTMFFDGQKKLLSADEVATLFEPVTGTPTDMRRVAEAYRKNMTFLAGDLFAAEPAVPVKSFDLVVCNNLLLHLKEGSAAAAWDYLHRYMTEDGLLLVAGCNPTVRAAAARRLNLVPCPEKLSEISKNWAGVSGAWNFPERPAWAYPEPDAQHPLYAFQAGEIFKNNPDKSGRIVNEPPLPAAVPAARPRNIIISGTSFWNPGDDFVREGVIRVLRETFGAEPLNFLFYNFNPDVLPAAARQPHSNIISQGDLEQFRDHVDAIVIVGVSAGHELKPLYQWVLANSLAHKVCLISGHYESAYAAEHIVQEPEASVFRQARLLIGRTRKHPEAIRTNGLCYHHVNCPALLSVPEVKAVPAGKKIERIGFSIQLPAELGGLVNQSCGPEPYRLAMQKLHELAKSHEVEVVAHHKTEYFHFLKCLQGTGIPVRFSSFYQDLLAIYRRHDLVITTRLHTSLFANGHGIPGIIINDTDRHTHALEGFPHSPWVNTPAAFEAAFQKWCQADLAGIAREAQTFKTDLIARYVQILRPAMNETRPPATGTPSTPPATTSPAATLDDAARILFVRTDSIGDAILASAMIEPLRRRFPRAELAVLCQQYVAELFAACPLVNSVICYDRKQVESNPAERAQILAEIAAFKPDLVLNSVRSRDTFSDELTLAIQGARHIAIAGDLDNITPENRAAAAGRYERLIPTPEAARPELERHADFLRGLGIAASGLQPVTWTTPEEELLAGEFFKAQGLDPQKTIALFPGAQHEVRVYRGYAEALKALSGYRLLIFGDASQNRLAEEIALQLPGRTVNLCGRSSLRETVALVRRCRLYVGAESAGAHIACAVGVPNVVLLGGGHFARFMPYSPLTSAVSLPLDCFGCNWRCQHKRAHCIKDVAPELVAEAIRQTLDKKSARARLFIPPTEAWSGGPGLPARKKPDAWLTHVDVEIIEATMIKTEAATGFTLPPPPPPRGQERVACPACGENRSTHVRQSADIVRCLACETVYLRTRMTKESMRELYQSYAKEGSHMALPKSRQEAEQSGLKRDYLLEEILSFVKPGGSFLDVGCGWGAFLLNARSRGFSPRGIELTRACVGYANSELAIPVTDVQLEATEIAPGSLRVVTMNHVFEHLPEPRAALEKVLASLEAGGMFCGIVPNFASYCSDILKETWYWLDPNYHYQHFTPATLRRMLETAGFIVERIYTVTGDYGRDAVRKAGLKHDGRFAEDNYFNTELARLEGEGRGEEIRFFARKPATLPKPPVVAGPEEECLLIPALPSGPEPLVTVVVSTYQSEKFIRACLDNLTRQTIFDRCEVIVVDSGSPENERAIVAEFQQQFPNIRYLRTARETLYAAWNRGLGIARGRYWANVNTDDSLRPDALAILAAALDQHADCALAYADCAWTTRPNDTFPSAHIVKTVKYPDYAPVDTLFYCLTGCLQFFRTESLRTLGGFDATLKCAGDYEATLKLMAARLNAVHVPEVLSLFFQNTGGLTQASDRAAMEHDQIMNRYRNGLNIANIFQVNPADPSSLAEAWAALGVRAGKFSIPWEANPFENNDFAFDCFWRALDLDPENLSAGMYCIQLHQTLKRLNQHEAELVQRWPKMREWINRFRSGEGAPALTVKHALVGPVYRPGDWSNRPSAAQLANEPQSLRPWITRIDGRHVYLSEDLFPQPTGLRYEPRELDAAAKRLVGLLAELPPFHAHIGGAGDALLLLAAFYDQSPEGVVFCHPNGVGAARALFDAFPKLSKIYFLPQHPEPFFHIVLRYAMYQLKNCLGAGTTPQFGYEEEWKAGLDIFKKYHIKKAPRWAAALRRNTGAKTVTVAPKGSLSGMIGSKRNVILPELWPQVLAHILSRGYEPVILGLPGEATEYPALPGCTDARRDSFPGQMKRIGESAGLVGADSWAKSFSALAEIPTVVFEPIKGADLCSWKDPSDWVFIEPWPSIKMIRSLEEFRTAFDARIARLPGAAEVKNPRPVIAWEGSFLDYGSLSHINRELTARLPGVTGVGPNALSARAKNDPEMRRCANRLAGKTPPDAAVTVRHQWPPNWSRPQSGLLVVIQPWEFGVLPKAWVEQSANVDEFWVPSPLVRHMYVDSGIAPEKVRVVPNGVDIRKFHPGAAPLKLATKKKFKFLFVGGTIFRKGPDVLLEAYAQTFTAADDVCLVIKDFGGDTFYQGQTAEQAIRAIQQRPNAPEILYLTEELASAQMPGLYAACQCFVLPYRGEGFGMPVLEAMACGLPVIVTAGGATESFVTNEVGWKIASQGFYLGEQVGGLALVKRGWLLEPSRSYLGKVMKTAASRPDDCRKRGAAGRSAVERRFDWSDIAAMVAHRLAELAERAPVKTVSTVAEAQTVPVQPKAARAIPLPEVAKIGRLDEARELFAQNDFAAAWNAALAAVAQRPYHPVAFLLLAEIAQAAGDANNAGLCLRRAREFAPGWQDAKNFKLRKAAGGGAKAGRLPAAILQAQSTPRLSVCLIAKNEEAFLGQCLKSIRSLAAQIIVVDTGSTDRTVEIAREFGAEVYAFPWCDDFAAARNAALEHATGDWVLILDADEELPTAQHAKLLADMKHGTKLAFRLPLVNFGQENEGRSFIPRLFRNAPGVFFHGRIHEQVFPSLLPLGRQWGLATALGTAEILHHGYTQDLVQDRNKIERNLKLLEQAIAENPTDANLVMNLGLELVRSDRLDEGIEHYREAYRLMSAQPAAEIVPELREALLTQFTSLLYKVRAHDEVVEVLTSPLAKAGKARPGGAADGLTASLNFALGLSHFELRRFGEAADQMRQCLGKRQEPALTPINVDIHSAAPWHCLALCLAATGDAPGAEKAFKSAFKENQHNEAAQLDYAKFLRQENRPVDALHQLHEIVTQNGNHLAAWKLGGEIGLADVKFTEFARDWTGEAHRALPQSAVIAAQRAEALMLNGDTAAALELWEKVWTAEPQARSLAALILCEVIESPTTHAPDEAEENATSQAFIQWYQRLIAVRANAVCEKINDQTEKLTRALPTASQILQTALAEVVVA